jgi:hypothetical protein
VTANEGGRRDIETPPSDRRFRSPNDVPQARRALGVATGSAISQLSFAIPARRSLVQAEEKSSPMSSWLVLGTSSDSARIVAGEMAGPP